jgi:methylmalonyl-CoA mutase
MSFNRVEQINKPIVLKWPLGPITFEIAKLELCDYFYNNRKGIQPQYRLQHHRFAYKRNKTYDYNVNMLRTTTECMSAIIGGADAIYLMMRCTTKTMNLVTE